MRIISLCAVLCMIVFSGIVQAADIPPSLMPLTSDLLHKTRSQLKQGMGDEEHKDICQKAYRILRQNGLYNWEHVGAEPEKEDLVEYSMEGRKYTEHIRLLWNRKNNDFRIEILDRGDRTKAPFKVTLTGKVKHRLGPDGKTVLRFVEPSKEAITARNYRELQEELSAQLQEFAGEWQDQKGDRWTVQITSKGQPFSDTPVTLKNTVSRRIKEKAFKTYAVPLQKYWNDHLTYDLMSKVRGALPVKVDVLEKQSRRIVRYNKHLDNLEKTGNFKLSGLAKGVAKDLSKSILKNKIKEIEEKAWIDFFKKDIRTRAFNTALREASRNYWNIRDQYMIWQGLRDDLIKGYDPMSGFKETERFFLKIDKTYKVKLILHRPEGRKEDVFVGIKKATPLGEGNKHVYTIVARGLNRDEQKRELTLKINFTE